MFGWKISLPAGCCAMNTQTTTRKTSRIARVLIVVGVGFFLRLCCKWLSWYWLLLFYLWHELSGTGFWSRRFFLYRLILFLPCEGQLITAENSFSPLTGGWPKVIARGGGGWGCGESRVCYLRGRTSIIWQAFTAKQIFRVGSPSCTDCHVGYC